MKIDLTPFEANVVRVALFQAYEREKHFQENCPDCVSQNDLNYLELLNSAYSKLL